MVLFQSNFRPIVEIDSIAAPYAAFAVALRGSVDLSDVRYLDRFERALVERPDGGRVSRYPPGSTFAAVPFAAPFAWIYGEELRPSRMRRLGKWVATFACAAAVVAFAFLCASIAPGATAPATLLLAAGTTIWSVASQSLWTHGPALLWVVLGMTTQWMGRHSTGRTTVWAGVAYGLAVFTRPSTALFLAAGTAAALLARRPRAAAALVLGAAGPVALWLAYDLVQFGAPLVGGYGGEARRFETPIALGLAGLLVAPSRGLFVYSPALVLALVGAVALWRGSVVDAPGRPIVLAWIAAALGTLGLYAGWHAWAGGWCFGPRFLTETLPVWALLFAVACRDRLGWSRGRRLALGGLVAVSIAIHALGVFGHGSDWNARNADEGRYWSVRDTQIAAHARHLGARWVGEGRGAAP